MQALFKIRKETIQNHKNEDEVVVVNYVDYLQDETRYVTVYVHLQADQAIEVAFVVLVIQNVEKDNDELEED